MRLIFVRHGEPNYEMDCLTPTGREQAAAAARRLAGEGITSVYSSTNGRARETAEFTAKPLGLSVTQLDYMHEISWGGPGIPENGHPWTLSDWLLDREGFDFAARDWQRHPYFAENAALRYYRMIAGKIDGFMLEHGYRHEGGRYFCRGGKDETVALFGHGGSGACALAHLMALPFPYIASVMTFDYTSVSILEFPAREGEYVHPRLALFNDAAHIRRQGGAPALQQVSE